MKTVYSEAPTRIDLAGGTLDIPPIYLFHQPAITINMAIDAKAKVTISTADKTVICSLDQNITAEWQNPSDISWDKHPQLELILRLVKSFNPHEHISVDVHSGVPAGSGLGGSSAIAIALTSALARWFGKELLENELVEYAKSIETQTVKVPTGYQDYWGAVHGKIHAYEMGLNGKPIVSPLGSDNFHAELERHLLLVYTEKTRFSGTNDWEIFKKRIDGDAATIRYFEELKEAALLMKDAFGKEDIHRIAEAMNQDWNIRKVMLPTWSTPEIETMMGQTFRHGAFAGRVCGAGGGGCSVLLIDPSRRGELTSVITAIGMRIIPAAIAQKGLSVKMS